MESEKLKEYLKSTINELKLKISIQNTKYVRLKMVYVLLVALSLLSNQGIVVCSVFQPVTKFTIINLIFSFLSAISVGLLTKFDVSGQKQVIKQQVQTLAELKEKLNYVVTCNGNLPAEEYKSIIKDIQVSAKFQII